MFTCKATRCCRDSKMALGRQHHVFYFGTKLIVVFVWSKAVVYEYLKRERNI